MNTDLDYSIIKVVASLPWPGTNGTRYRATVCPCSDFAYENAEGKPRRWSDEALESTVGRYRDLHAKAIRCDRDTWERAHHGMSNGWTVEPNVDAEIIEVGVDRSSQ